MAAERTGLAVRDPNVTGGKKLGALSGYVGVNRDEVVAAYLYVWTARAVTFRIDPLGPMPESLLGRAVLTRELVQRQSACQASIMTRPSA